MKIKLMTFLLVIGCLAAIAQGRFEAGRRSYQAVDRAGATTMAINATSLDDNKISVKFCFQSTCYHGKTGPSAPCFCCRNLKGQPCFLSGDECKRKCPACDPVCPPPPATTDEQMLV
ncbi:hypothetical protein ZWY2020_000097 [Hordeum vulgare]|nr:hypothetical protein ZWY2020_000097 [Hordeum vulgare]